MSAYGVWWPVMIEKRSIVLTSVVLAMLFTGMVLFLVTNGGLQQARIATDGTRDFAQEEQMGEEEEMDTLERLDNQAAESAENKTVAGVTRANLESEIGGVLTAEAAIDRELPQDIAPTAATGIKGYVVMAAGLSVLMGLIGMVTAWRKSAGRQAGM
jgi:hypothetical protein